MYSPPPARSPQSVGFADTDTSDYANAFTTTGASADTRTGADTGGRPYCRFYSLSLVRTVTPVSVGSLETVLPSRMATAAFMPS